MFNAPLKIRENLDFKKKTFRAEEKKEHKDVTEPADLFEVEGKSAEKIYMLGEAGRGKTGQCYQLLHYWLQGREAERKNEELSEWQRALVSFDLLFFITLRHVDKRISSLVEMICRSVMKNYRQYHDTIREVLSRDIYTCKCLILLDGLDEMKGMFDIDVDMSRCTVLMTSRHWKFYVMSPDIDDQDKVVEVCALNHDGIKTIIEKVLVNYFEIDPSSKSFTSEVTKVLKKVKDVKLNSIFEIPMLLTASIHLWQRNTTVEASFTSFYASIVNLMIKIAFDNERISGYPQWEQSVRSVNLPIILTKQKKVKDSFGALLTLGKVAYNDLVLGAYQSKNNEETKGVQLVFEKDDLEEEINTSVLTFALNVGLLGKSFAPGTFDEENACINFFHQTMEEFLAALYVACKHEISIDSFLGSCSSVDRIMELSNILVFLVGLEPSFGSKVSKQVSYIADLDEEIIRYRMMYDGMDEKALKKVMLLFDIICNCHYEQKYSRSLSKAAEDQSIVDCVSDVYLGPWITDTTNSLVIDSLSKHTHNIKSLNICDYYGSDTHSGISSSFLTKLLDNSPCLKLFRIFKNHVFVLHNIAPVSSSLTVLALFNISLTRNSAHELQDAITSNKHLRVLQLCLPEKSELGVKDIFLDLKNNSELIKLTVLNKNIQLVDIMHCKNISKLDLRLMHIHEVDMLQSALSSFTHLRQLTIQDVSFTGERKLVLDLMGMKGLTTLDLESTKVEIKKIGLCLEKLVIKHVTASLRGLMLALPDSKHLRNLTISSLYDKHDAKVLIDVLPRQTRLQYMEYSCGRWTNIPTNADSDLCSMVDNAAVVQAIAKMTGLKSLYVNYVNMGSLAMTLTPSMAMINFVSLFRVYMTAKNWCKFIYSVKDIQHTIKIRMDRTNIDDESLLTVHSIPHFKVTYDEKRRDEEKVYGLLKFTRMLLSTAMIEKDEFPGDT